MCPTGSRRKRANADSCTPLPSALALFYFLDSVFNTAGEILSAPLPPAPNPASRKGSELSHRELLGLGFPICVISKHQVTPRSPEGSRPGRVQYPYRTPGGSLFPSNPSAALISSISTCLERNSTWALGPLPSS